MVEKKHIVLGTRFCVFPKWQIFGESTRFLAKYFPDSRFINRSIIMQHFDRKPNKFRWKICKICWKLGRFCCLCKIFHFLNIYIYIFFLSGHFLNYFENLKRYKKKKRTCKPKLWAFEWYIRISAKSQFCKINWNFGPVLPFFQNLPFQNRKKKCLKCIFLYLSNWKSIWKAFMCKPKLRAFVR